MDTARVLVVDDEAGIRDVVTGYLRKEGYQVTSVEDGPAAIDAFARHAPDVVVLDVMLPGMDGLEVLRELRRSSDVYVILLTARADETDKLVGLSVGADDYITKPFSPREVVARVKAVLRRARSPQTSAADTVVRFSGLEIDAERREVRVEGRSIEPSTLQFDILAALAGSPGRVFSRRQLIERVWGWDFFGDERVVDVHIRTLRKLLGDDAAEPRFIRTVRGVGYKFVGEHP